MKFRSGQIALAGELLLLLLAAGCQGYSGLSWQGWQPEQQGLASIFSSAAEPVTAESINISPFPADLPLGAIVSPERTVAEKILASLPGAAGYETVVLLAPTKHKTDAHRIFTYQNPGVLAEYGVDFDEEIIVELKKSNAVAVLPEVTGRSYWNSDIMKNLKTFFPNAHIAVISINENLPDFESEMLGYILKTLLPAKSIVIALADFQPAPNENMQDFRQKFTRVVLQSADIDRFDELPAESTVAIKTLGYYLRFVQAQKIHGLLPTGDSQQAGEDFQATFSAGAPEKSDEIFLVFFGDIMLGRYVRYLMDQNGLDYPFEQMDNTYLRVNDLLVANLEGPVTEKAVRTTSGMSFGFFPDVAPLLKKYHFDVLSQANNHTLDKRKEGYDQSMQFLRDAGLAAFGYPREINEDSVAKIHIRGQQMAFLGLEEVLNKIDADTAVAKIQELTDEGYKVIVFPHWGIEYTHKPNARQQDLAHRFIDAGAIAIIGHHPHVAQAYETYSGRPIFYSLGNAVFDQYWSAETQVGLSVAMIISDTETEIFLAPITLAASQMKLMDNDETRKFLEKFAGYGQYDSEQLKNDIIDGHLVIQH